ncbi:peptide MFS transporter [Brevundimonas aveniformis]|uniref:peptide MFS transporter n=1 Tax=Brevundimonas aveniformis TaxID=370977 RepID=UPI0004065754|nr:oligopeptide:H+ symporter [Brevundimonas aveniformis]
MTDVTPTTEGGGGGKTIFGHPRGLVVLFFAEMWERFSYYGMRALLVLFLVQHFLMSQDEAAGTYAAYAALVYLLPIVGGAIADKWLGARKAVTIGALFLVAGHFAMAFEGSGGQQFITVSGQEYQVETVGRDANRQQFAISADGQRTPIEFTAEGLASEGGPQSPLPALTPHDQIEQRVVRDITGESTVLFAMALIVVGVGFLKANISNVVGALYEKGDQRRDAGFTWFYVGINLGSLLAKILCGWIGLTYGWAYGFGLAGIGMLLGLIVFQVGQPWLEGKAGPPPEATGAKFLGIPMEAALWIGGIVTIIPVWLLLQRHQLVETGLSWLGPMIFLGMLIWSAFFLKGEVRSRMLAALVLCIFSVLFWMLFEQAGSSLTLMAQNSVNMPSFMNAAQSNIVNPLMIVILGPIFAILWQTLAARNAEPSTPFKFSMALIIMGLSFVMLAWATTTQADSLFKIAFLWLALTYVLHTIAELMISPIGLSMITKLSAPKVIGVMMGVWFLSSSLAHALGGVVAGMTATETVGGVVTNPAQALATYGQVYNMWGWVAVGVGAVLLLGTPILKRMMAGVK